MRHKVGPPPDREDAEQQSPLFSILDGAEKESRLAIDDIKKLIDAGKEKAI
jgi:hypothetical protein